MIRRIRIKNFLSYGDTEIHIPEGLGLILGSVTDSIKEELDIPMDFIGINGSNGAGKSGFIEAMTWGLWGIARSTDVLPAGDHLIRRGTSDMEVDMSVGNEDIGVLEILRSRSSSNKGVSKLVSSFSNSYQFGKNISDVQKQIIEIIGMEYKVFKHTYFIKPNESANFSLLKPSEAKEMVMKILNLERWMKYHVVAKNKLIDIERKVNDTEIIISTLNSQLGETANEDIEYEISRIENEIDSTNKEIETANGRIKQIQSNKESADKELTTAQNELNSKKDRFAELIKQRGLTEEEQKNINRNIQSLQESINTTEQNRTRLEKDIIEFENKIFILSREYSEVNEEELRKECDKIKFDITKKEQEIIEVRSEINSIISRIKTLSSADGSGICPILSESCDRVGEDAIKPTLNSLQKLKVAHTKDLDRLSEEKNILFDAVSKKTGILISILDSKNKIDVFSHKVKTNKESIGNFKELLETNHESINNAKDILEQIEDKLKKILNEIAEVDKEGMDRLHKGVDEAKQNVNRIKDMILVEEHHRDKLRDILDNYNSKKAVKEEEHIKIKEIIVQVLDKDDELVGHKYAAIVSKQVMDAFSKDGIPLHMIDISAATIENIANNILAEIGKDIAIRIKVESITQKQKIKDTFEIVVNQGGHEVLYKMYSGGESFWIDFALRMALAIVEHNISGSLMDTFIIDEGIGKLDTINRELFMKVLKHVCSNHGISQILLVTHTDISESQRAMFDFIITAKKDRGISSLECVTF